MSASCLVPKQVLFEPSNYVTRPTPLLLYSLISKILSFNQTPLLFQPGSPNVAFSTPYQMFLDHPPPIILLELPGCIASGLSLKKALAHPATIATMTSAASFLPKRNTSSPFFQSHQSAVFPTPSMELHHF
jgi:hypothetical protein